MSGFILCPSCANNFGEVMVFVTMARRGLMRKTMNAEVDPEMVGIAGSGTPAIGHILDAVGITKMCCRMHMLGATASPQ